MNLESCSSRGDPSNQEEKRLLIRTNFDFFTCVFYFTRRKKERFNRHPQRWGSSLDFWRKKVQYSILEKIWETSQGFKFWSIALTYRERKRNTKYWWCACLLLIRSGNMSVTRGDTLERLREQRDGSDYFGSCDKGIRTELTIEEKLWVEHFIKLYLGKNFHITTRY